MKGPIKTFTSSLGVNCKVATKEPKCANFKRDRTDFRKLL